MKNKIIDTAFPHYQISNSLVSSGGVVFNKRHFAVSNYKITNESFY